MTEKQNLQDKEKKTPCCPLMYNSRACDFPFTPCLEKDCALWNYLHKTCSITAIATELRVMGSGGL